MMKRRDWWLGVAVLVVAVGSTGCTVTRSARLYDLDAPSMEMATYRRNGSGHGPIWLGETQANAACSGEYVTVPQGSSGWGAIYGKGGPAYIVTAMTASDQQGRAIVTCGDDGRVIECEYVVSALTGSGHGACEDNAGKRYRVMFGGR